LGVPHLALAEVKIGDFIIPKGATASGSLYHSMRDQRFYFNPEQFCPQRFLNAGKFHFVGLNAQANLKVLVSFLQHL
jgi:cytochrome P450